jgi:hypothetical protein
MDIAINPVFVAAIQDTWTSAQLDWRLSVTSFKYHGTPDGTSEQVGNLCAAFTHGRIGSKFNKAKCTCRDNALSAYEDPVTSEKPAINLALVFEMG